MPTGKPTRKRKKKPHSPVTEEHFRLLREYGRHPMTQQLSKREEIKLWELLCTTARVPIIKREEGAEAQPAEADEHDVVVQR